QVVLGVGKTRFQMQGLFEGADRPAAISESSKSRAQMVVVFGLAGSKANGFFKVMDGAVPISNLAQPLGKEMVSRCKIGVQSHGQIEFFNGALHLLCPE